MYPETGMLFPYLQAFPSELHSHFHPMEEELLCRLQSSSHILSLDNAPRNTVKTTTVSDYDLGGEGDLFKAPEPIVEEPAVELDPVAAAMWMISNGEAVIPASTFEVPDVDPIQNEQFLIDAFYDSQPVSFPPAESENLSGDDGIKKSVSSGSLESSTRFQEGLGAPGNLSTASGIFTGDARGMRRACSEGDLQTYSNGVGTTFSGSTIHLPFDRLLSIGEEERQQKLSRYRKKKNKRNFGRKIKYACRKALADNQPRVRGRFARTEDSEPSSSARPISSPSKHT